MGPVKVHVMGPPEGADKKPRRLQYDERFCDAEDEGQRVVFHPKAHPFGSATVCPACGESSAMVV